MTENPKLMLTSQAMQGSIFGQKSPFGVVCESNNSLCQKKQENREV
jgi:hypothetical protein